METIPSPVSVSQSGSLHAIGAITNYYGYLQIPSNLVGYLSNCISPLVGTITVRLSGSHAWHKNEAVFLFHCGSDQVAGGLRYIGACFLFLVVSSSPSAPKNECYYAVAKAFYRSYDIIQLPVMCLVMHALHLAAVSMDAGYKSGGFPSFKMSVVSR